MSVFEISPLDHGVGLKLAGELDLAAVRQLEEALLFDVPHHGDLHLDLSELAFVDSSGVRTILAHARTRDGNGRLVLTDATPQVGRVFELMSLDDHPCIEVRRTAQSGKGVQATER